MIPQKVETSFQKQKLTLTTLPTVKLEYYDTTSTPWFVASEAYVDAADAGKVSSVTGTTNEIAISGTSINPVVGLATNPILQGNVKINATGYIKIPVGTMAQRPSTPEVGMIRIVTGV